MLDGRDTTVGDADPSRTHAGKSNKTKIQQLASQKELAQESNSERNRR